MVRCEYCHVPTICERKLSQKTQSITVRNVTGLFLLVVLFKITLINLCLKSCCPMIFQNVPCFWVLIGQMSLLFQFLGRTLFPCPVWQHYYIMLFLLLNNELFVYIHHSPDTYNEPLHCNFSPPCNILASNQNLDWTTISLLENFQWKLLWMLMLT